jgi:hypothetical protein
MNSQDKKKIIHSEKLDLFPKQDEIYGEKQKELQELMFNNKSAMKRKKQKDYYKQKNKK